MPYSTHKTITIPGANIPSSQTDYPLLVSGTFAYLATVANFGLVTSSAGDDIIFTSDAAGTVILDFERVFYRATDGFIEYRIRTQLTAGVDYTLYCFFGNSSITSYQGNVTGGTWGSAWRAVYHFADGTTLSGTDSTANANTGTPQGGASAITGKIDGAAFFSASGDYVSAANTSSMRLNTPFAIRAWVNLSSYHSPDSGIIAYLVDGINNYNYILSLDPSGKPAFEWVNGSFDTTLTGPAAVPLNTWTQLTFVITGATVVDIYINGVLSTHQTSTIAIPVSFSGGGVKIGGDGSAGNLLNGGLDELQFFAGSMTTDLIAMLYANESAPGTFYAITSSSVYSETASGGFGLGGAAAGTMTFSAAAAAALVFGGAAGSSFGYGNVSARCSIGLGGGGQGVMGYNSPAGKDSLVFGGGAITSTGTVPIECVVGTGTGGAVITPGSDPGFSY